MATFLLKTVEVGKMRQIVFGIGGTERDRIKRLRIGVTNESLLYKMRPAQQWEINDRREARRIGRRALKEIFMFLTGAYLESCQLVSLLFPSCGKRLEGSQLCNVPA